MRVLCAYRYGIVGGVSTQLLLRQQALQEAEIDCHLYFAQDNGLKALRGNHPGVSFGAEISLRRLVRRERPEIAIVVDSPELIASLHGWGRQSPRIYLDVHTTTSIGLSYLHDLMPGNLAGVLTPTRYSAGLVRQRLPGFEPLVVPNLIDTALGADGASYRHPEDKNTHFIWVGKLDSHKNWRMALFWGHLLHQLLGDFRLTLVGGYTAPDKRVDEFLRFAVELGLDGHLRWLDRIDNSELPGLYRQVAHSGGAMLVTSRDESFGMAVAEALLCGCPVIANDLPVFREVFPDSPMMQRIDVWQPETFLDAVERLSELNLNDEPERVRGHLARHFGRQAFIKAIRPILGGERG